MKFSAAIAVLLAGVGCSKTAHEPQANTPVAQIHRSAVFTNRVKVEFEPSKGSLFGMVHPVPLRYPTIPPQDEDR